MKSDKIKKPFQKVSTCKTGISQLVPVRRTSDRIWLRPHDSSGSTRTSPRSSKVPFKISNPRADEVLTEAMMSRQLLSDEL